MLAGPTLMGSPPENGRTDDTAESNTPSEIFFVSRVDKHLDKQFSEADHSILQTPVRDIQETVL